MIYQSYINHYDYSFFGWNIGYWRSRNANDEIGKSDGRIRFMMYDTDMSLGNTLTVSDYPLIFEKIKNNNKHKYLFECERFVSTLYERVQEIVGMLSSDDCKQFVQDYVDMINPLVKQDNYRYFGREEVKHINNARDIMIDFINNRATFYLEFVSQLVMSI